VTKPVGGFTVRRCLSLALVLALLPGFLSGAQSAYHVERIVDGDTVVLSELGTARLIGVDTPETVDPRRPVEAFGYVSSAFLTGLIGGKTVRVDYDQTRRDKYGRVLVYLHLPDGTFVNREIVRQGYGHAYTEFPFRYMDDFRAAEREARAAARGLWANAPAAPLPLAAGSKPSSPAGNVITVYVTRTGTKYHRAGCRSLARSQIPMALSEAAQRYGPCSICRPPTVGK
jgi:micrococcal nuclease